MVKVLGESLQVHVRSIHVLEKLFASFFRDIAGRHSYTSYSCLMTSLCRVDGIFQENDRIVV